MLTKTQCVDILWLTLQGELVDIELLQQALIGLYDQDQSRFIPSLLADRSNLISVNNPARIKEFRERWRPVLGEGLEAEVGREKTLSQEDIQRFGAELRNCAENVDSLFGGRNLAGLSVCTQGEASDSRALRPAGEMRGWSLTFTVRGQGDYNCTRTRFVSEVGDMVLYSPEAMYDHKRYKSSPEWRHYWLYIQQEARFLRWLKWPEIGPYIYLAKVPADELEAISSLFVKAIESNCTDDVISQSLLENQIEEILIRCQRFITSGAEESQDPRVEIAKEFISQHLTQEFSIHDVADAVELSKARLSSLFKLATGQTVFQWRDERRIAKASQLLMETPLSVKEVARKVGYSDPLYFSKCFKKLLKVSPSRFRQE